MNYTRLIMAASLACIALAGVGMAGDPWAEQKCNTSANAKAVCAAADSVTTCSTAGATCFACRTNPDAQVSACGLTGTGCSPVSGGTQQACGGSVSGTCIVIDQFGNLGCQGTGGTCASIPVHGCY
jgi:hypothetical protein